MTRLTQRLAQASFSRSWQKRF